MELKQLEYFVAIVDSGAFSRAAMKLSVGQPMLSRQIKALEGELGVELYHRTGRGIVLTEAGKVLHQYARGILETAGSAKREVSSLGQSPTGSVVIAMPPSVGAALAAPVIAQFCEKFPRVALGVMEGFSAHVLEWLLAGRLDVAILYNAPRMQSLQTDPLLTDELILLGPTSDMAGLGRGELPTTVLKDVPLVLPSRPHGLRLLVDNCLDALGVKPQVRIEIDAMPTTLRLVEAGLAYTVLSYSCVHDLVSSKRIRYWRLVDPPMTRTLVIASSTQRPSTKAARSLAGIVRREAEQLVSSGRWHPPS